MRFQEGPERALFINHSLWTCLYSQQNRAFSQPQFTSKLSKKNSRSCSLSQWSTSEQDERQTVTAVKLHKQVELAEASRERSCRLELSLGVPLVLNIIVHHYSLIKKKHIQLISRNNVSESQDCRQAEKLSHPYILQAYITHTAVLAEHSPTSKPQSCSA